MQLIEREDFAAMDFLRWKHSEHDKETIRIFDRISKINLDAFNFNFGAEKISNTSNKKKIKKINK